MIWGASIFLSSFSNISLKLFINTSYGTNPIPRISGKSVSLYNNDGSIYIKDGSFIKPLSREARHTGDGTNPSLGIIDRNLSM